MFSWIADAQTGALVTHMSSRTTWDQAGGGDRNTRANPRKSAPEIGLRRAPGVHALRKQPEGCILVAPHRDRGTPCLLQEDWGIAVASIAASESYSQLAAVAMDSGRCERQARQQDLRSLVWTCRRHAGTARAGVRVAPGCARQRGG